ncbi:hypothetical protein [Chitinimonas arctica]|nr:hypothetical protein [Chitinimonas arctica]
MMAYIGRAASQFRLSIYARYLDETEMARMRQHYGQNAVEWPPLISQVRGLMASGAAADSPSARELADRWNQLSRPFAGDDAATRQKLRLAMQEAPELLHGTGIDQAMLDYVRAGISSPT